MRIFGFACILLLLIGSATAFAAADAPSPSPGASASAPASQVAGAAVAARAKEWLHRLQAGDIDRSQLTDKMSAALTADTIKQISGQLAPLGDPQSFTPLVQQSVGDMTAYVYRVAFKATTLNFEFVLDKDGKVAGLLFPAAQ